MPVFTEAQTRSNPILNLAAELRRRTCGLCDVGAGPWGYGVNNSPLSKVGVIIRMDPDPNGEEPLPPEVKEYTVTLQPICGEQGSADYNRSVDTSELQQLCGDRDIMTRFVANALRELSNVSVTLSRQEDIDGYEAIRTAEQQQEERFTTEELKRLEELRWYETKTPDEIVDFQLSVAELCMPAERFQAAAEAVFKHPVDLESLSDCWMALLEERREMKAAPCSPSQESGPVMM